MQRTVLERYAPAAVVTNRQLAPLYFFGAADRYLRIADGEPNQDLLSMAREGLRPKLRDTIARAFRSKQRVDARGVWFKREGRTASVAIEAQHLIDGQDDLVLVSFIDELPEPHKARQSHGGKQADNADLALLRQQLTDTTRELDRTIHELQEANEQLKGKNEEAMSLNEEFLSTNEELESSKEELQSLNEELTTVNAQLRQTLEQQQQASADLSNLLNSSSIATIFLDAQLRIKIFNPRMMELFSLIDADIGRPLADLLPKFADPTLLADAMAAQSTATPSEHEIRAETGVWVLAHCGALSDRDGRDCRRGGHLRGCLAAEADRVRGDGSAPLRGNCRRHHPRPLGRARRRPQSRIGQRRVSGGFRPCRDGCCGAPAA